MNRKYKNTPLVESLCEFQFIPSEPWDITVPGLFYKEIKKDFPNKEEQHDFGIGLEAGIKGFVGKMQTRPRLHFSNNEKTNLVQLGPDMLAVNRLAPYQSWESFKPLIKDKLDKYIKIASPKGFKRIGLRYINKVQNNTIIDNISAFFNYYPNMPEGLFYEKFNIRTEIAQKDNYNRLVITLVSLENKQGVLLDLDYIMNKPEQIVFEKIEEWLDNAHDKIIGTFESAITETARNEFD